MGSTSDPTYLQGDGEFKKSKAKGTIIREELQRSKGDPGGIRGPGTVKKQAAGEQTEDSSAAQARQGGRAEAGECADLTLSAEPAGQRAPPGTPTPLPTEASCSFQQHNLFPNIFFRTIRVTLLITSLSPVLILVTLHWLCMEKNS